MSAWHFNVSIPKNLLERDFRKLVPEIFTGITKMLEYVYKITRQLFWITNTLTKDKWNIVYVCVRESTFYRSWYYLSDLILYTLRKLELNCHYHYCGTNITTLMEKYRFLYDYVFSFYTYIERHLRLKCAVG